MGLYADKRNHDSPGVWVGGKASHEIVNSTPYILVIASCNLITQLPGTLRYYYILCWSAFSVPTHSSCRCLNRIITVISQAYAGQWSN